VTRGRICAHPKNEVSFCFYFALHPLPGQAQVIFIPGLPGGIPGFNSVNYVGKVRNEVSQELYIFKSGERGVIFLITWITGLELQFLGLASFQGH
jgi:hypothetical protein